jgi:hypothetical protein
MATSIITPTGDIYDCRWNNGQFLVRINMGAEVIAVSSSPESGMVLELLQSGAICLVFQNSAGVISRVSSSNRGRTWL